MYIHILETSAGTCANSLKPNKISCTELVKLFAKIFSHFVRLADRQTDRQTDKVVD